MPAEAAGTPRALMEAATNESSEPTPAKNNFVGSCGLAERVSLDPVGDEALS